MTKEQLIAMGLTEEQADSVMKSLDGAYVPKTRFNEVNEKLTKSEKANKEKESQIEKLQESENNPEDLKKAIAELRKENEEMAKKHEQELKAEKTNMAVEKALINAKARNIDSVRVLLKDVDKAEFNEDGTLIGLEEQIKALVEGEETSFLFEGAKDAKPQFKGVSPSGNKDKATEGVAPISLSEAVKQRFTNNE